MMQKALLGICIVLFAFLSTLAHTAPKGRERVELFDIEGNPLPPEVLKALYFNVRGTVLNASQFASTFNRQLLTNLTIEYCFLDNNWSLGYAVHNVSESLYIIRLKLKDASTLNLKFYNLTTKYIVLPHVTNLASIVNDPTFTRLKIEIQMDDIKKPLKFTLEGGNIYIPLTNYKNQTYPWILKVFHQEILMTSSQLAELINGTPLEVPILVVSQRIELDHVLDVDPVCNLTIRLSCNNLTLSNTPPQLTLQTPRRWYQPKTEMCQVEYIFEDQVIRVCKQSLEKIFHNCSPGIYSLRIVLRNADENLTLEINSSKIDISKPIICVSKGNYKLDALYNFSGLLFKLWEKNITVTSNDVYTIQFNFTNLAFQVKNKGCTPTVYINGTAVGLLKNDDIYEIKRFPLIPININVKVCELYFTMNISLPNNIEMTIDLPPSPVNEQTEIIDTITVFILFFIITLQIFLLIFLLVRLRGG